jgi:probable HAF family extracellular repeat protein
VGTSDTSVPDPLGEDFCGFGDHLICLPFLWQNRVMTTLPTLGGNNGQTLTINDRGNVAGFAENSIPDSTCIPPEVLHFEPVIWNRGNVEQLPVFPGDLDGLNGGLDDVGQTLIASDNCAFLGLTGHDSLYQQGTLTEFGYFGGNPITGKGINNRGQVVGVTVGPSNNNVEAILWQNGVVIGLGVLPGAAGSVGNAINDKGQVVGQSCDATDNNCRGFPWQNGVMTDLNTLVPAGTDYTFPDPVGINSRGQIVGLAVQTSTGQLRAFLLTPCGEGDDACTAAQTSPANRPNPPLNGGPGGIPNQPRARRFPGRRTLHSASGPTN